MDSPFTLNMHISSAVTPNGKSGDSAMIETAEPVSVSIDTLPFKVMVMYNRPDLS